MKKLNNLRTLKKNKKSKRNFSYTVLNLKV